MFFLKTIKKRMRAYEKLFDLLRDEIQVLARAIEHQEDEHAELAERVTALEGLIKPTVISGHVNIADPDPGRIVEMTVPPTDGYGDRLYEALVGIGEIFGMSGSFDVCTDVSTTAESLVAELKATRAARDKAEEYHKYAMDKMTSVAKEANNNCDALRARLAKAEEDWRRECALRTNLEKQIELLREQLNSQKAE